PAVRGKGLGALVYRLVAVADLLLLQHAAKKRDFMHIVQDALFDDEFERRRLSPVVVPNDESFVPYHPVDLIEVDPHVYVVFVGDDVLHSPVGRLLVSIPSHNDYSPERVASVAHALGLPRQSLWYVPGKSAFHRPATHRGFTRLPRAALDVLQDYMNPAAPG